MALPGHSPQSARARRPGPEGSIPGRRGHGAPDLPGHAPLLRPPCPRRPTVVVFEDVHWLDGSSASLLEHLLPLTREAPLLFCLVSRPEAESALTRLRELTRSEYAARLTEIDLRPLSPEESALLVRNLAKLDDYPRVSGTPSMQKPRATPSSWKRWSAAFSTWSVLSEMKFERPLQGDREGDRDRHPRYDPGRDRSSSWPASTAWMKT